MEHKPRIIATVINDVIFDQRMIRICSSLSKQHDVALWGRKQFSQKIDNRPYSQRRFSFLLKGGPLFYLAYNIRIFLALLFTKVDIIHTVDLDTLLAGHYAARIKNVTHVYDSHEFFTEVPELVSRPKKRAMWLRIEKSILPKIKNAITVGQKIADEYKELYGVEFQVIRNAPLHDSSLEQSNIKRENFLFYPGALNKGRGLENVILALKQLPELSLKLAGTGDIEDDLKTLVKKNDLEERVLFLGVLPKEDLIPICQSAFAGINISENLGRSYFLSLNNKYFDFLHAGLPAITNEFPEYVDLNSKYECCVFADSDADDIAMKVKLLQNDTELYNRLNKNCFLASRELNWQREEQALIEFYANLK